MTPKSLARHYGTLSPGERVPLLHAALARGDEAELERLARSAAAAACRLPDYHGLSQAVLLAALFHSLDLLELAALFWRLGGHLAERDRLDGDEATDRDSLERAWRSVAYLFAAKLDGWRSFCSERGIDPDDLLGCLPGSGTILNVEAAARAAGPAEEAAARLRHDDRCEAGLVTAESIAASLVAFVNRQLGTWG